MNNRTYETIAPALTGQRRIRDSFRTLLLIVASCLSLLFVFSVSWSSTASDSAAARTLTDGGQLEAARARTSAKEIPFQRQSAMLSLSGGHTSPDPRVPETGTTTATPGCGLAWAVVPPESNAAGILMDLSVLSSNDMWSVGYAYGQTPNGTSYRTRIEHWNGATWSTVPSPNRSNFTNVLNGVDSVSSSDVWAVGYYYPPMPDVSYPLILHWNGTVWSALDIPPITGHESLNSVVALAPNNVWAVGTYDNATTQALIMHYDGTAWSPLIWPGPDGVYGVLNSVEAVSPNDIWAVGYNPYSHHALAMHYNGTAWTEVSIPSPGTLDNDLSSLSARAADDVWAVGFSGERTLPTSRPLIEHWDGISWSVVPSPQVPDTYENALYGVSARAVNDVWAVGNYVDTNNYSFTLTMHYDGTQWQIVPSANVNPESDGLQAVVALGAGNVWAVGWGVDSKVGSLLYEHYADPCGPSTNTATPTTPTRTPTNGPTYTPSPSASPTSPVPPTCVPPAWQPVPLPTSTPEAYLNAVDGISSNDVWAVGYTGGETSNSLLIMHWNGQAWSVIANPPGPPLAHVLNAVHAVSANNVWAAGSQNLIIHWDGTQWSVIPTPLVDDATVWELGGVAANDIWAVGNRTNNASIAATLVEHWNGAQWQVISSPNVGTGHNYLYGVTALSATDVWAAGEASLGSLIIHWDGTQWQTVPVPPVGDGYDELRSIFAVAPNDIWAVGYHLSGQDALIMHWDGTRWSIVANPPGSGIVLNSIDALSANDIWAAGFDYNITPVLEHWNGTEWSFAASPNPTSETRLWGIAAISYNDVWAVGDNYYLGQESSHKDAPLAYRPEAFHYSGGTCQQATSTATYTRTPTRTATGIATLTNTPPSGRTATPTQTAGPCEIHFSDVQPPDYFYEPVRYLYCNGSISGYSDNTFRPFNNTTRGQLSKIVVLAEGWTLNTSGGPHFSDVLTTNTFYPFVETAYNRGVISGYSDGTFRWDCSAVRGVGY